MRPSLRTLLATIVVALAAPASAGAVLDGQPDTEHRYVGLLVTVIDGEPVPVCSGFLVAPRAFVTAGHCVNDLGGVLPAFVSFDQTFTGASPLLSGTAVPNPDFRPGSSAHEIALVLLDHPVTDRGFAQLPSVGFLEPRARSKPRLTVVGYGASGFLQGGGRPPQFDLVRRFAETRLVKLEGHKSPPNFRMSSGICFGDSGGPVLFGDSDLVVGINSFVSNQHCAGNAYAYRMDTAEALGFLAPYL
jgi:hypothetical protein